MGVAFAAMSAPMLLVIKKRKMSAPIISNIILRNGYCSVIAFFESTGDVDGRPRFDMSCVGSLPAEVNPVATCDRNSSNDICDVLGG